MSAELQASAAVDLVAAQRQLDAIAGRPGEAFSFQAFDDSPAKRPSLARVLHGTLLDHAAELERLNAAGAGIFFTVSRTNLTGRAAADVVALRALFVDVDRDEVGKPWALEPDVVTRTARGWHTFWTVDPLACELEEFTPAQRHLASFYGADTKVCDLPRVMRLAGFFHRKGEPFLVQLLRARGGLPTRDVAEVLAAHPVKTPVPAPLPARAAPAPAGPDLEQRIFRASRWLAKADGAVSGQGGHDKTFDVAQALVRGFSLPSSVALDLLVQEYSPRCEPPWSVKELEHKVADAAERSQLPDGYLLGEPEASGAVKLHGRTLERGRARKAASSPAPAAEAALTEEPKKSRRGLRAVDGDAVPDDRPEIRLVDAELHKIVEKAEAALLSSPGAEIYQRDRLLVRTLRSESLTVRRRKGEKAFHRPEGALVISAVTAPYLMKRLTEAAQWKKWDGRAKDWVSTHAPSKVAEIILASAGDWRARPLLGILEAPTLRPDGSILQVPGYDEDTGLLLEPGATTFEPVPENPTRADALAALGRILPLLAGFPFVAESDRSAALSAILTGLVRRSVRSAPLHAFTAPKMRSGKSLLADVVALFATGRPCAVLSQADQDEERKRLLAVLLAGDAVVSYDNLERPLEGAALCQALTQSSMSDRILGLSQTITVPTCVTFLATGNNLVLSGDLTSRAILCSLDPQMERPEERRFAVDLYEAIPETRHARVPDALTILRAYHLAGRPDTGVSQWGGFEDWNGWVRAALVWLDQADPATGRLHVEDLDPVRRTLRAVLAAWFDAFERRLVTVADVLRATSTDSDLKEALLDFAGDRNGEVSRVLLGKRLQAHVNRIEGGLRFVRRGTLHGGAAAWGVTPVDGDSGDAGDFQTSNARKLSGVPPGTRIGISGGMAETKSPSSPSSPVPVLFDPPEDWPA